MPKHFVDRSLLEDMYPEALNALERMESRVTELEAELGRSEFENRQLKKENHALKQALGGEE